MTGFYTLRSGMKISIYIWRDFLEEGAQVKRRYADVSIYIGNTKRNEVKAAVHWDDSESPYIIIDDERVYIRDFEYLTVAELVKFIDENRNSWMLEDLIWATLMKDTENVGILCELPMYEMVMPQIGIGFTGDRYEEILCVPSEKQYKKIEWNYKFSVVPEISGLQKFFGSQNFYMSDFASHVKSGQIRIVDKEEYKTAKALREIVEKKPKRKVVIHRIFKK